MEGSGSDEPDPGGPGSGVIGHAFGTLPVRVTVDPAWISHGYSPMILQFVNVPYPLAQTMTPPSSLPVKTQFLMTSCAPTPHHS